MHHKCQITSTHGQVGYYNGSAESDIIGSSSKVVVLVEHGARASGYKTKTPQREMHGILWIIFYQ